MPAMEEIMFQLRFSEKQMERLSKKAEKDKKVQEGKVKKALIQGNVEGARIYAENAIRKKNEALNYLRFASKLDAVNSRVQSAMTMKQVARNMEGVVKSLEKAINSMDLQKVSQVMDKFEKEFEDLDVHSSVLEKSMGNAVVTTAPLDQVDALIKQVAEENGLEIAAAMPAVAIGSIGTATGERSQVEEDNLLKRLASLREH